MAAVCGEPTTGPGDIQRQLRLFLQGSSGTSSVSYENLSSSALFLLRTVPVARHAVLDHYAMAFDDAIKTVLSFSDHGGRGERELEPTQMSALQDVTGVLLSFIKASPEAWAPVVSSWSLSLLGQVSSKYAAKRGVQHATSLNQVLQMWMACQPAKMLVEITTECFAAMVGGAPDICVDALLEASVRYSPHFDWVVAHIGSCFPRTIITRVLNCGLKDFCSSGADMTDKDSGRVKVPKMASVVGILGHLASKHSTSIRKALMSLFEASVKSEVKSGKVTTLPFLLQLASMSDMLLQILTTDLVAALTPAVLNTLHRQFTHWKHASPSDYNSFLKLVVHLIGKCTVGACDVINFFISTAVPLGEQKSTELPVEEVRDTCIEIMHILMFELQRGVLSQKMDSSMSEIPLLTGLSGQTERLTNMLLNSEGKRVEWLLKLLTYTALQNGEKCASEVLVTVLFQARTPQQLGVFYKLKQGIELGLPAIMTTTLNAIFTRLESLSLSPQLSTDPLSPPLSIYTALHNLERVAIVEKHKIDQKAISVSSILECIGQRHLVLCTFLHHSNVGVCKSALKLMTLVGFPHDLGVDLLTQLCGAVAGVFFISLHRRAHKTDVKATRLTQLCMSCIEQLSRLPFCRSLMLHYLVEGSVQKEHLALFGGRPSPSTSTERSGSESSVSLLEENRQQSLSIALPRFHSSVYHGGVILNTGKLSKSSSLLSKDIVSQNCVTFIETLWLCCREMNHPQPTQTAGVNGEGDHKEEKMETDQPSPDTKNERSTISESAARTLGCVIVDILNMDSLYNDVHWQDPDFRKVTTERDMLVWKRLEETPVLLSVIQEFSSSCVFLYYASPVLRSAMAVVMNHLEVSRSAKMHNCPKEHELAVKLVHCLAKGSLIVPPLSNVAELFPFVSPYEGYLLLLALWRYIKDNPPCEFESEMRNRKCDSSHMFVVHSIIHSNIEHMGQLCSRIFNM